MTKKRHFLIVDGYAKASRDELEKAGMKTAFRLYDEMLRKNLPGATSRVWLPSDTPDLPGGVGPEGYAGILWTGCNLTIYHHDDVRVTRQLALARRAYEVGTPGFGTCWGIQMGVVAAGGEVKANPLGREMGVGRKIHLTPFGAKHPFMAGKPPVYNGFISHVDQVTRLPRGAVLLATNDFTHVQAVAITHKKGTFWGLQYHPEYDLHEMARLMVAREGKLVPEGFFTGHADLTAYVKRLEELHANPGRKDLRWQLDIDDDVLDRKIRQTEVANWINRLVLRPRRK
jgi:GMP synthase (glutamine-hydrolysing)